MSERQWIVFVRRRDEGRYVVSVDFGLRDVAPLTDRPWAVVVGVALREPQANGLPSARENADVERLADRLFDVLGGESGLVGRIAGGGRKELVFYLARGDVGDAVRRAAAEVLPQHAIDCDVTEDAGWERFARSLVPTARERQSIFDREILHTLRQKGDPLTERRPILHWAYFPDEASRERAAVDLASQGFRIENRGVLDRRKRERPFSLRFAHDDVPDAASVEAFVDVAHDLCSSAGGEYDGWETAVRRAAAPADRPERG
jgi:hypothetical protein